jgi:hypothetical protein
MSLENASSLTRALTSADWRWNADEWRELAGRLGLREVNSVLTRRSYQTPEKETLSAYFDGDRLEFVEITLDIFKGLENLSESEQAEKISEFLVKFNLAVDSAVAILGKPLFRGGPRDEGFPDDQDAIRLALWLISGGRFMIEEKHEDKELPIRVSIVVAPTESK